ncbi:MAG: hypothetical protein Q8O00_03820 [Holophaga sp.]|nr:hypothetical protein [Holophaga sp.]
MFAETLDHLREIWESPWEKVTLPKLLSALTVVALVLLVYVTSEEGWVPVLDSLNLVFHEAGHPLFSPFGETLHFLGGTLMQLLVPAAVVVSCWYKRQAVGAALAGVWFFQNGFNIARSIADAREQILPLVGGGEHDWATLLGRWGVLAKDLVYAATVRRLAWVGITVCCAWLVWRWYQESR